MYGLVNRAIEQLVVSVAGAPAWQRVCGRAGVDPDGFLAMQAYDDALTYRLVGSVSEEIGQPPGDVLRAFGEYWILYTADEGYGDLMAAAGSDLRTFLANLDALHARVEAVFPSMVLPHFSVTPHADGSFDVHYRSQRVGLAAMVQGLLVGLAKRFGSQVDVQHIETREGPGGVDVFRVTEQPARAASATGTTSAAAAAPAAGAAMAQALAASPGGGCPFAASARGVR